MEYLDRSTPVNPALNFQCYNLFKIESILKNKRGRRKKKHKRMSDKKQEITEEKEKKEK